MIAGDFSTTKSLHASIAAVPRVAAAVAVARTTTNTSTIPSVDVDYGPLVKAIGRFCATPVQELPYVVAEGVSREFFEDFLSAYESNYMGARLEYRDSRILICECPVSEVHECVVTSTYDVIRAALGSSAFGFRGGAPSCRVGASSFQPDASLTPFTKPNPGPGAAMAAGITGYAFPNVVIEVAVSQSLEDVQRKARDWLGPTTTVQQVLVFKVGTALVGGARQLHADSYIRGNDDPVQTIDFSIPGHAILATGNLAMQLRVPHACLYFQVPGGPPAVLTDPLFVDLYYVQQAVAMTPL
jgi:Uma2 family endonuclease